MTTPGDREDGGSSRYMPRSPDPTTLTSEAVERATGVFRRELTSLRETIETRLAGSDRERELLWTEFHAWPDRLDATLETRRREFTNQVTAVREALSQRMDAMDKAVEVALRELERFTESVLQGYDTRISADREYAQAQLDISIIQARERFASIQGKFAASETSVDKAFAAAKEAVDQQNKANSAAIGVSEANTKEQLMSLSRVTDADIKALAGKVDDARDRISAIENLTRGIEQAGGQHREERGLQHGSTQLAIASAAALIAVISVIVTIVIAFHKLGSAP